jgi:hypothetical protein
MTDVPDMGEGPKTGCGPVLLMMILVGVLVGGGFVWVMWFVLRDVK